MTAPISASILSHSNLPSRTAQYDPSLKEHIDPYLISQPELYVSQASSRWLVVGEPQRQSQSIHMIYAILTSGRGRWLLVRGSGSPMLLLSRRIIDETMQNTKGAIEAYLLVSKEDQFSSPAEKSLFTGRVRLEVAD